MSSQRAPRAGAARSAVGGWWVRAGPGSWSPAGRRLAVVLVLGAVVRLVWIAYASRPYTEIGDPATYLYQGRSMAEGGGYISLPSVFAAAARAFEDPAFVPQPPLPSAFHPIGYPAFVTVVAWLMLHTPVPDDLVDAVAVAQVALGVATIGMVHAIARRLFGDTVALVAAALVALFPELIFYSAIPFTETLFTFLVLAVVLGVVWHPWARGRLGWPQLVIVGVLLGVSMEVRPFTFLLVPVLAVLWLVDGAGVRRVVMQTGALVVLIAAVLTPWTIRNYQRLDAFVPLSTNLGDTICISRAPGAAAGDREGGFDARGCSHVDPNLRTGEHPELRNNRANIRRAVRFVREHPQEELRLQAERLFYAFAGGDHVLDAIDGPEPFIRSGLRRWLVAVSNAYHYTVLGAALIGIPLILRRRDHQQLFLVMALTVLVATIPLLLYGLQRFHVPVLPLMAIAAAVPLDVGRRWLGSR